MTGDSEKKITVEQLLRLKRSERPSAEFWVTFERELRARQLSALVERRPRWQGLFAPFARHQLGLGAAAALMEKPHWGNCGVPFM